GKRAPSAHVRAPEANFINSCQNAPLSSRPLPLSIRHKKRDRQMCLSLLYAIQIRLLEGNLCASLFQLSLDGLCVLLGSSLLDDSRSAVNLLLSLLQAQAGDCT